MPDPSPKPASSEFADRHLGPREHELTAMLKTVGAKSLDDLITQTLPDTIRTQHTLDFPGYSSEHEALKALRTMATQNQVIKSCIGAGYYDCITPTPILRNILENPGWYTQYTPYQAEISQGRLEALLNFQTMVGDLTGLPVANASLLDEATAAAEAMAMCWGMHRQKRNTFFVDENCHPQTIAVVQTRAEPLNISVVVGDPTTATFNEDTLGGLLQYPGSDGRLSDPSDTIEKIHNAGAKVVLATDLLALCLLKSPGSLGADIAIGSTQRFGVPLGFGGPHAAFLSTLPEHARRVPGRIVGVSQDAHGRPALRLAMQTREQHIRREKATSNICTAQVLLAIMASMYAVYHGPQGLRRIAQRVHQLAAAFAQALRSAGVKVHTEAFFDTVSWEGPADTTLRGALDAGYNLRKLGDNRLSASLDETSTFEDVIALVNLVAPKATATLTDTGDLPASLQRDDAYLTHPVFNTHHSETQLMRYMHQLETKDLSLNAAMIPLGSCTMKLNAASELVALSWPEFSGLHPFAPLEQAKGYLALFDELEARLKDITGFAAISFQPNAGSQGEYAGLLCIRGYHQANGQGHRNVCLIPQSAHGTNPASAVMAGFKVVVVACDDQGNIDVDDLKAKIATHEGSVAALMITYPSTHGVFEESVVEVCQLVHDAGGQVYLDGANLNAKVGLSRPAELGADVAHLNLHKTFAIPHGGGGPGMGPIGVAKHLVPFLPQHPATTSDVKSGPIAAAPWGSPSILTISYMYIQMMGGAGLTRATQVAILNANYMAKRLEGHYDILFRGQNNRVAHEFIIDLRPFKASADITVDDVAKRLMDYGFHAPTMSWPVAGTMMIEPTESEPLSEIDRFCDAMIQIREEISAIESGQSDRQSNPLKGAPHTAVDIASDAWDRAYSREQAAFPTQHNRDFKYWPPVSRVDNAYGDRNFVCSCPPIEDYT